MWYWMCGLWLTAAAASMASFQPSLTSPKPLQLRTLNLVWRHCINVSNCKLFVLVLVSLLLYQACSRAYMCESAQTCLCHMCVYVCVCVSTCVRRYVYTYVSIFVRTYVCIYVCMYVSMYANGHLPLLSLNTIHMQLNSLFRRYDNGR